MGMIVVEAQGSFHKRERKTFSAQNTGHADAVAQAIEYLTTVQLPEAIRQDHKLLAALCESLIRRKFFTLQQPSE